MLTHHLIEKDISKATQRILDHRAFVNGEIDSFLQNFETQRNDAEVEKLFKLTETIGVLRYDLLERCNNLCKANLDELANSINNLHAGVDKFLNKSKQQKPPSEDFLEARNKRALKKKNFLKDIEFYYARVANSCEEKEEEISGLYSDLQLKLNIYNH